MGKRDIELTSYRRRLHRTPRRPRSLLLAQQLAIRRRTDNWSTHWRIRRRTDNWSTHWKKPEMEKGGKHRLGPRNTFARAQFVAVANVA